MVGGMFLYGCDLDHHVGALLFNGMGNFQAPAGRRRLTCKPTPDFSADGSLQPNPCRRLSFSRTHADGWRQPAQRLQTGCEAGCVWPGSPTTADGCGKCLVFCHLAMKAVYMEPGSCTHLRAVVQK